MPLRLHKLNLSNFRNHAALRLNPAGAGAVVLTGRNGAGKTSVLEAVSLLAPGRGLRGETLPLLSTRGQDAPWAVAAEVETPEGEILRVGTGLARTVNGAGSRRVLRVDGRDLKTQAELGAHVACVWLTPQMDGIFTGSASDRRRFLDRLVLAHDPGHAARVSRAEKNMRARLGLLLAARETGRSYDAAWIKTLEVAMAEDFTAIAASRLETVTLLNEKIAALGRELSPFPLPALSITGPVEDLLQEKQDMETVTEEAEKKLTSGRSADGGAGRTLFGTHRADLETVFAGDMPAAACSTGEQKGMLAAIVLAHALMLRDERGAAPLVLLDEIAAHLDAARQETLFALLGQAGSQVWITGTEPEVFAPLKSSALFLDLGKDEVPVAAAS